MDRVALLKLHHRNSGFPLQETIDIKPGQTVQIGKAKGSYEVDVSTPEGRFARLGTDEQLLILVERESCP